MTSSSRHLIHCITIQHHKKKKTSTKYPRERQKDKQTYQPTQENLSKIKTKHYNITF